MKTSTETAATVTLAAIGAFLAVMLIAEYTAGMYEHLTMIFNLKEIKK